MDKTAPLVLASASPRRKELLARLVPQFEVEVSGVDEDWVEGPPEEVALTLALHKAEAVAAQRMAGWVLGADTVIDLDGRLLAKPADPADAVRMLSELSGRTHRVWTAVALLEAASRRSPVLGAVATAVRLRPLSPSEVVAYVESGEPMDKAGAYAIQGRGADLVAEVEGCYNNVVGLPLCEVRRLLEEAGQGWRLTACGCLDPDGLPCPRSSPWSVREAAG
ncbi:MAG: Maf family protein [Acidobacteriota bacterium]